MDFGSKEAVFMRELAGLLAAEPPLASDFALSDENWDSMAVIAAIALIDNQFGVTVPGDRLKSCTTVGQLACLVRQALEGGAEKGLPCP